MADAELPERLQVSVNDQDFELTKRENGAEVTSAILSQIQSPEFSIVGYGLSTDGWLDPTTFLRSHGADINPAAFQHVEARRGR
jgi:hypothetical protein